MMNTIGEYGKYRADYESNVKKSEAKKSQGGFAMEKTKNAEKTSTAQGLSDKAKELLKELRAKYPNMDIMVGNYSSDEEAQEYLSRGTKEYSVLIEPELLEQMAEDDSVKEKYMNMIDEATNEFGSIEEMLASSNEEGEDIAGQIKTIGVSIKADGTISYFAQLEKSSEAQKERIEKAAEDKKEKKSTEEKRQVQKNREKRLEEAHEEKIKRGYVEASSAEELAEKIRGFDWNNITEEIRPFEGGKFNFTA